MDHFDGWIWSGKDRSQGSELMAVRHYNLIHRGRITVVSTDADIPRISEHYGITCRRCGAVFPDDGPVSDALAYGCRICGSHASFSNIYLRPECMGEPLGDR